MNKTKLAWLAGIIDGEGSIIFRPYPKSGVHLCRVSIANTDLGILDAAIEILDQMGVYHTKKIKPPSYNGRKPCYAVEVCRQLGVKYLLERLLPYLESNKKKENALKILWYIKNRKRLDGQRPNRMKRGR